jgi:flagellar hook protein FlgE
MIETQRTYSTNAKVIQTSDEMLSELTQLKR